MAVFSKIFSLPLLALLLTQANALCYYPDGTPAPGDVPCTDSTANSVCCGTGYACLSNGICQATGDELKKPGATEFVRGSCTDKTFRSSSCPSFCGTPDQDNVSGGEGMAKCTNTDQDLYWCINAANLALQQNEDPCTDENAVVFFPASTSPKGTGANTGTGTGTSTTTPTSPAETSSTEQKSSSNGGVIGGAVGGSLGGLAIIGGLAFFFLRRRRGSSKSTIHEMDYTPVEPSSKISPSQVVDPMPPHTLVHEAPGSSYYEPAKTGHEQDAPMELPA
ncbi:hypothetical protein BBK36DRAFT_22627 [Trichoderma citrinoviride]|uniref:Mid2 domain-containing protein n=1 Tax=Trichoderma citrinoviride TaxID=58853 RepID=A0A2T4B218_9HYPO|nr:hypothetical protein BBK36DRAFT_22627 [Trichoderma citrinoviride]PTB63350.1 hypothetical protein BBK36DRAFT_22627 [Trichoderma citrinoviride]